MEKIKLLCWFWILTFSANIVCADEARLFKKDIFGKAQVEARRFAGSVNLLKKNITPTDRKIIEKIMRKAKKKGLEFKDTIERAKMKAKKEATKWQDTVIEAKANAKKFAKNWKVKKNDKMRETFTGYADLPTTKGVADTRTGFYIFVSLGLPKSLLKSLDDTARRIGARLVIRGIKGNSFKETFQFISDLRKEGLIVDIHPKLFRKFKIVQVPSFVMWDKQHNSYDKMMGNVTIGYVLEEFVTQGDTRQVSLKYQQKQRGNL